MSKPKRKKSTEELYAESLFNEVLKTVMFSHLGEEATNSLQLTEVGKILFNDLYAGTFSKDNIPRLTPQSPYCIVNTDESYKRGEHWLALALDTRKKEWVIHIFDSFKRSHRALLEKKFLNKNKTGYKTVNVKDKQFKQGKEKNWCGQASMAFLIIYHFWSKETALLI